MHGFCFHSEWRVLFSVVESLLFLTDPFASQANLLFDWLIDWFLKIWISTCNWYFWEFLLAKQQAFLLIHANKSVMPSLALRYLPKQEQRIFSCSNWTSSSFSHRRGFPWPMVVSEEDCESSRLHWFLFKSLHIFLYKRRRKGPRVLLLVTMY